MTLLHTNEPDRVRAKTADEVNERIDRQIEDNVLYRNKSHDQIRGAYGNSNASGTLSAS